MPRACRSSARPTWTSSRWAPRPSTRRTGTPTTPGTSTASPAVRVVARPRPSPRTRPPRDRHGHRRLDPSARRRDRHGRRQADLRRRLPLRPHRHGVLARPGGPRHSYRPRLGAPARAHRRPRPSRLDLDQRGPPAARRRGPPGCDRRPARPARRRRLRALGRGLPGGRERALRGVARPAALARRRDHRGLVPALQVRARRLLPDHAERGVEQPREVRRHALRPARRARGRPRHRRARHVRDPRPGLRRRGQAPHHPGHLRPVRGLLRRLLRQRAEGPHAHPARLRRGVRAGGRPGLPDGPHHGLQVRREARRPARDVPQRRRDDPREPRGRPRHVAAERTLGRRPARRLPDPRAGQGRRPSVPRGCRPRGRPGEHVGRAAAGQGPELEVAR